MQGEEVWLQSLGSDPQTQQRFPEGSSYLGKHLLTLGYLYFHFTCWLSAA